MRWKGILLSKIQKWSYFKKKSENQKFSLVICLDFLKINILSNSVQTNLKIKKN
jgi:hypothetical protein